MTFFHSLGTYRRKGKGEAIRYCNKWKQQNLLNSFFLLNLFAHFTEISKKVIYYVGKFQTFKNLLFNFTFILFIFLQTVSKKDDSQSKSSSNKERERASR